MFGLIISGRLVQTDVQQVSENQFLFNITDAGSIKHIVIFMTGQIPFPDQQGGAVYFSWPSTDGPSWQLLGHITNEKPSAIFKISSLKSGDRNSLQNVQGFQQPSPNGQLGISVERLSQLNQQTPAVQTSMSNVDMFVDYSSKMLQNFFNYASSFAVGQSQMTPNPTETYVPLSTLQKWFENFKRRLEQNPNFWRS